MKDPIQVSVPLVNPNEPESVLAELRVAEGDHIEKGQVLATFETTKSTYELAAEYDGFVIGLHHQVGDTVRAGEVFCYLASSASQAVPSIKNVESKEAEGGDQLPEGLRITQPAIAMAKARHLDLGTLPIGILITEKTLQELAPSVSIVTDPSALLIYGGGGHAKSLIDLIRLAGQYHIIGILDDGIPAGTRILDVEVLGGGELLPSLFAKGIRKAVNAVGGIGSITPRLNVYSKLAAAHFQCVTVVHPRAFIEPTASMSEGCQVFFNAYIGSEVTVGFGSIINTGAIISHDCRLGEYVNISPGAILAGAVKVGDRALIGMGATINLGVNIGEGARVGNSAVVKADVPENGIVRAGAIWPLA